MATITIGSSSYESYSSVAEADDFYLASSSYAAWSAYGIDDRKRGLVSATRLLERQSWQGAKVSDSQTLEFPRTGLTCNGVDIDSAGSSTRISDACNLLALKILNGDPVETKSSQEAEVKRIKAGSVEVENFRLSSSASETARFPVDVMEVIGCFMAGSTPYLGGTIVSGTDREGVNTDYGYVL